MSKDKNKPKDKSRRRFLIKGGLGTVGILAIGTYVFRNPLRRKMYDVSETLIAPYSGAGTQANLWFEITNDNALIIHSAKVEMGQGSFTGIAQIVADELDFDITRIQVKAAQTDSGIIDRLATGGSLSIASLFNPLREMAATMREMIKREAAKKWNVEINSIKTSDGTLASGTNSMTFAEALKDVTEWSLPKTPKLRSLKDYKVIGQAIPRIDLKEKVTGAPIFGMDAEIEDMLFASVIKPEKIGATIKSINSTEAEKMPGNIKIIKQDQWVGIVADSFAEALAARNEIEVEWDSPKEWTEESLRDTIKIGNGDMMVTQKSGNELDEDDANVFSLEFTSPLGAHAQIEPNGAVASVKDGKATVILSTQVIGITQNQVAKALGFSKKDVNIIPTFLGGGFGRRLNCNHAVLAAKMSKEIGKPIKYFFTRKDEFQNDTFRPPTHHIVKGKLNDKNELESLEHHYASGDVAINSALLPGFTHSFLGTDIGAMRGANIMYNKIENRRAVQWHSSLPFATSWWRSLGLLANTFAIESFIDEMALKAGVNAVDFRLKVLGEDQKSQRIKKVLQVASDKAGYTESIEGNTAMGFAASIDVGSPCAHVAVVSIVDNKIKVEKVTCVMDCGLAVNPDQVIAQCEGSILMGISASLHEKMTIRNGSLYPENFGPYKMAKMKDCPKEINVHLIQGVDDPLPVGEPPLGPIGAAIGNAVRRLTGTRLTDLPMEI